MNVLIVTGSYPPAHCGVGDYVECLVSALTRKADLEVSVLTSRSSGPAVQQAATIMREMPTWDRRALSHFREVMQRKRPDVVHVQFPTQGYDASSGLAGIACLSRFKSRVPVVVTLHEYLPHTTFQADRSIYALAVAANVIIVVRPKYYQDIRWPWKAVLARSKIRFIENASALPTVELTPEAREAVKHRLGCPNSKLIAFFGFAYPHKGAELLFQIGHPAQHHLLFIGELREGDPYHDQLRNLAGSPPWRGNVTFTGFVHSEAAARLLAAADAVVFPYRSGGGIWNSSVHAAAGQGTFTIMTSLDREGYDLEANVYYARPDDVEAMRHALLTYQGVRRRSTTAADAWARIAEQHRQIYVSLLSRKMRA